MKPDDRHVKEDVVTNRIRRMLERLRIESNGRLWWVKLHGGHMQRPGLPDFLVLVCGKAIFIEAKRPVGGEVSAIQEHEFRKIRIAGAVVRIVRDEATLAMVRDEIEMALRTGR